MIGHVYNKRNVLAFNGELRQLKAKCNYLLAHELAKNQFTVMLNNNDGKKGVISVAAYGQPAIEINGKQAFVNDNAISLPHRVDIAAKSAQINVRRIHNGVSIEVNKDLLVTCYEDSNSCTVGITRWYTGKVSGLLGESTQDLSHPNEENWYLDSTCKLPVVANKASSPEAVKTCYALFGEHKKSQLRDAFLVIT